MEAGEVDLFEVVAIGGCVKNNIESLFVTLLEDVLQVVDLVLQDECLPRLSL